MNQDAEAYNNLYVLSDNLQIHAYNSNPELKKTKIFENYQYFAQRVKAFYKKHRSIDGLWDCFDKLEIVKIELELSNEDKPQLVFETINATGKSLDDSDLIRNYILMDKEPEVQQKWYNEYWKQIEYNTYKDNTSHTLNAIWYYLMYKQNSYFTAQNTYTHFKSFIVSVGASNQQVNAQENVEKVLQELVRFTKYYKWFHDICPNKKLEEYFEIFRTLKQTTPYTYFMSLMDLYDDKQVLEQDTVCEVLNFILNYYMRRTVIGRPTNPYNKMYPALANKINSYTDQGYSYLESLYCVFSNAVSNDYYPTDGDIRQELPLKDFYNARQIRNFVLQQMCNFNQKESIVIDKSITIEHIMPQSLTEKWKQELGENWQTVHEKYVHTIGNLTLTGYNSEHSRKSFLQKRELMQQHSNIPLNKYFNNINSWNETQILKNAERMIGLFNQVFPDIPNRMQYKKEYSIDYIPIEEIGDVTGTKIISYKFFEKIESPMDTSWNNLFKSVCKNLSLSRPIIDCEYFFNNSNSLRIPYEVVKGVYIETDIRSAKGTKNRLIHILEELDCVGELALKLEKST